MGHTGQLENHRPAGTDSTGLAALANGQMLDALLDGQANSRMVSLVARSERLPEKGRYAVAVRHTVGEGALLDAPPPPSMIGGLRVLWQLRSACQLGVVVLGDVEVSTFADAMPVTPGWRTGVSLAVGGLASLWRGRQLAELAARTIIDGHGVACLQHRMIAALLACGPDLADELSGQVLAPLLDLNRAARDQLLDTFPAWLAVGGSVRHAAHALYCHRNTVLNRLRRLEKLTQRSLSAPNELVELALAVEAFRLRPVRP
jgi:PucR C-terminal helix-turn-helix domain